MSASKGAARVFISSTEKDLREHREAASKAVEGLDHALTRMETFGARAEPTVGECMAAVAQSAALVLIVAHRYGWVPSVEQGGDGLTSMTELEVKKARELGIPVYAFFVKEDYAWGGAREEQGLLQAKDLPAIVEVHRRVQALQALRDSFSGQPIDYFTTADSLAAAVTRSGLRHIEASTVSTEAPPGPAHTDLDRYLHKLRAACEHLPVAGFPPDVVRIPIALSEVYVPLQAHVYRPVTERDWKHMGRGQDIEHLEMESRWDVPFDQAFVQAAKCKVRGAVVLGDPGSGKSTLLKHFVLACIEKGAESLGLPKAMVPVLVPLRSVKEPAKGLKAALVDALARPDIDMPADFADALLKRDELLVLIDGLDEVRTEAERREVSRWLEACLSSQPKSQFLLTSRYVAYRGDVVLSGKFLELHVQDLAQHEAVHFIGTWYKAVETQARPNRPESESEAEAARLAGELEKALFAAGDERRKRLARLATSPLLLQIICLVHRSQRGLPERRINLYADCVRVLLSLWREAAGLRPSFSAEEALGLLRPLAYWMMEEGHEEAAVEEALKALEEPLLEWRLSIDDGRRLFQAIPRESGLLVDLGQGRVAFLHLSFQEYLAAKHVQSQIVSHPELVSKIAAKWQDERYAEVLRLSAGLTEPALFEPLVLELVAQGLIANNQLLAGEIVDEAGVPPTVPLLRVLQNPPEDRDTRYEVLRLLGGKRGWEDDPVSEGVRGRDVVAAIGEHDPDRATRRLALELLHVVVSGGDGEPPMDPEAGEEWVNPKDGSVLVFVPAGIYPMGAEDISDYEKPVHEVELTGFWMGKYPVTNAQYRRFLAANPEQKQPRVLEDKQFGVADHPVVDVDWNDAMAYAVWAELVLPSEAQWEAAARGKEGRRYPWGKEYPDQSRANFGGNLMRTSPVTAHPSGAGPFGTFDQAGNVWEWCLDFWDAKVYKKRGVRAKDPVCKVSGAGRGLRGGSWNNPARNLATAYRDGSGPSSRHRNQGFRCARLLYPPSTVGS